MYFFGKGVPQDYAQSAFLVSKSWLTKDTFEAQYILGLCIYGGQGCDARLHAVCRLVSKGCGPRSSRRKDHPQLA